MVTKMTNDEIEELVGLKDYDKNMLKTRNNGLLLTDNQVGVLERYNIDTSKCSTMSELLYMIDQIDDPEDDELTFLAEQLSEMQYYNHTRK